MAYQECIDREGGLWSTMLCRREEVADWVGGKPGECGISDCKSSKCFYKTVFLLCLRLNLVKLSFVILTI